MPTRNLTKKSYLQLSDIKGLILVSLTVPSSGRKHLIIIIIIIEVHRHSAVGALFIFHQTFPVYFVRCIHRSTVCGKIRPFLDVSHSVLSWSSSASIFGYLAVHHQVSRNVFKSGGPTNLAVSIHVFPGFHSLKLASTPGAETGNDCNYINYLVVLKLFSA